MDPRVRRVYYVFGVPENMMIILNQLPLSPGRQMVTGAGTRPQLPSGACGYFFSCTAVQGEFVRQHTMTMRIGWALAVHVHLGI